MVAHKPHILVIDDDKEILSLIREFLISHGYYVTVADNTISARVFLQNFIFDLMIIDVMMPGEIGTEFTKFIRTYSDIPIIMLTALGEVGNRIEGLESGADDYLTKPFEPMELLLRIKNIVRRSNNQKATKKHISFGDIIYNIDSKLLKLRDEIIPLTSAENRLLNVLVQNIGQPISRELLAESCGDVNLRSIDVTIIRLRRKIEKDPKKPEFIQTIRSLGYLLQEE